MANVVEPAIDHIEFGLFEKLWLSVMIPRSCPCWSEYGSSTVSELAQ